MTTAPEWSAPPKSSSSWAWAMTPLTSAAEAAVVVPVVPQMPHGPEIDAKPSAAAQHGAGLLGVDTGQRRAEQVEHQHAGVGDHVVRYVGEVETRGEPGKHLARARVRPEGSSSVVHGVFTFLIFQMQYSPYSIEK